MVFTLELVILCYSDRIMLLVKKKKHLYLLELNRIYNSTYKSHKYTKIIIFRRILYVKSKY